MTQEQKIKEAMQTLKDAGYFVDCLWSIQDVQDFYSARPEQAQRVLFNTFTNEHVIQYISEDVFMEADKMQLFRKAETLK